MTRPKGWSRIVNQPPKRNSSGAPNSRRVAWGRAREVCGLFLNEAGIIQNCWIGPPKLATSLQWASGSFKACAERALEGIVSKHSLAPYRSGRRRTWLASGWKQDAPPRNGERVSLRVGWFNPKGQPTEIGYCCGGLASSLACPPPQQQIVEPRKNAKMEEALHQPPKGSSQNSGYGNGIQQVCKWLEPGAKHSAQRAKCHLRSASVTTWRA